MLPELAHQRLLQFQHVVVNSILFKGLRFSNSCFTQFEQTWLNITTLYSLNDDNG